MKKLVVAVVVAALVAGGYSVSFSLDLLRRWQKVVSTPVISTTK